MRQVYRIDNDGIYIEPVLLFKEDDKVPTDCIELMPPSFYKAKWTGAEWIEVGTKPKAPLYKSMEEELQEVKQVLDMLLMGGL